MWSEVDQDATWPMRPGICVCQSGAGPDLSRSPATAWLVHAVEGVEHVPPGVPCGGIRHLILVTTIPAEPVHILVVAAGGRLLDESATEEHAEIVMCFPDEASDSPVGFAYGPRDRLESDALGPRPENVALLLLVEAPLANHPEVVAYAAELFGQQQPSPRLELRYRFVVQVYSPVANTRLCIAPRFGGALRRPPLWEGGGLEVGRALPPNV